MITLSNITNKITNKIKSIKLEHVLSSLKIASLMIIGTLIGFFIHGAIGSSFGLILGYVLARSLFI
ncbi:MAG: hypothetical protein K1060chlam5_00600 [Candidatus Anoxychlamydiales bacterium]|nr:hypothetical protein [Candidatus Anoxychlamydiales bacterium]